MMHSAMNTFTYIGEIVQRIKDIENDVIGVRNQNEAIRSANDSIDQKNIEFAKSIQALEAERHNYVTQAQITGTVVTKQELDIMKQEIESTIKAIQSGQQGLINTVEAIRSGVATSGGARQNNAVTYGKATMEYKAISNLRSLKSKGEF